MERNICPQTPFLCVYCMGDMTVVITLLLIIILLLLKGVFEYGRILTHGTSTNCIIDMLRSEDTY